MYNVKFDCCLQGVGVCVWCELLDWIGANQPEIFRVHGCARTGQFLHRGPHVGHAVGQGVAPEVAPEEHGLGEASPVLAWCFFWRGGGW